MKILPSQVNNIINNLTENNASVILCYGNNMGYINAIINKISKALELFVENFDFNDLSIEEIVSLYQSQNLFGKRQLIQINNFGGKISKQWQEIFFEHLVKKNIRGDGNNNNIVIFVANDSLTGNNFRTLCDNDKSIISIPCYKHNESEIKLIVNKYFASKNINMDNKAYDLLISILPDEYNSLIKELEKLYLFSLSNNNNIVVSDITNVINKDFDIENNTDLLCIYFMEQNYTDFYKELVKIKQNNIQNILIIRAMLRYLTNLYIGKQRANRGENLSLVVKSLPNKIFYLYVNQFKTILQKISLSKIVKLIDKLNLLEYKYKNNSALQDLMIIDDLYFICTSVE